jgi:hypothetical protein
VAEHNIKLQAQQANSDRKRWKGVFKQGTGIKLHNLVRQEEEEEEEECSYNIHETFSPCGSNRLYASCL